MKKGGPQELSEEASLEATCCQSCQAQILGPGVAALLPGLVKQRMVEARNAMPVPETANNNAPPSEVQRPVRVDRDTMRAQLQGLLLNEASHEVC